MCVCVGGGCGGCHSKDVAMVARLVQSHSYLKTNQWQFVFSTLLATFGSFLRLSRHRGSKAGD